VGAHRKDRREEGATGIRSRSEVPQDRIEKSKAGMPALSERQVRLYGRILGDTMPDGQKTG
jgi:hypothetical protein